MNSESNHRDVDQQSSAWLDVDHEAQSPMNSELSADDQARIADLQMIDALLSNLSSGADDERTSRIRRAMTAIKASEPSTPLKQRSTRLKSVVAIAASLLVALSLAWTQFSRESRASVVLREIREMTLEEVDRVYDLRRHTNSSGEQQVDAKLYLRGRDGFVLRCGDAVLGRNGDEFWLVPRQGDVLVAESFQWMVAESERSAGALELLKQLSADSRKVPIMQLSAVVELMKDDYSLTVRSYEPQDRPEHTIVGTLREGSVNLPNEISLWADANSSIIRRAEFSWGPGNTLSLELAPTEQVPMKWYTHETHHDTERGIRRVSPESL